MKQYPSRLKFKKYHKVNPSFLVLKEQKRFFPLRGLFGLKALDSGKLTFKQLEAGRRAIRRTTKKKGSISINVFTNQSVTKKPVSSRMGKGKGSHSHWIGVVRKGQILYELSGVGSRVCLKALSYAGHKMPVRTKIVKLIY